MVAAPVVLLFGIATALVVKIRLGSPILFRQNRIGIDAAPFALYKFRTMRPPRPGEDPLASDGVRITPLGRFLRSTSLDELPTLINVLKGDMALVGPRPLLPEYLPLYSDEQRRRHEVKPGITGWAQVNGRNAISWEEKFELDVWYVDHRSVWLDMKILWLTVWQVLARRGVAADGHATMPPFRGSTSVDSPQSGQDQSCNH